MGYGSHALGVIENILACRDNLGQIRVLELGAQEINYDVLPSTIFHFIYRLNPHFRRADQIARLLPGCFAAPVFRAANVGYTCIDLFEADGVVQLDLNLNPLPFEHHDKYDLVTNMGTTEHIFNQARTFEAIHDAAKVGGIMLHAVPCNGLFNHGLIKYEPRFFLFLAHANKYEIVQWDVVEGRRPDYMPVNDDIPGSRNWSGRDLTQLLVRFVLRKRSNAPFVQPTDVDLRYVPVDFPPSIRNAIAPSTSSPPTLKSAEALSETSLPAACASAAAPIVRDPPLPKLVRFLQLIEARCEEVGWGPEPYALAATMASIGFDRYFGALESGSPATARQALDDMVAGASAQMAASPDGQPCSIDFGLGFLGTGWGKAGGDVHGGRPRHFRVIGPSGRSRVFVRLAPGRDYRVSTLLFDAVPGEAAHRLQVSPATDGKIEVLGEEYWHRSRLPKEAIDRQSGLIELTLGVGEADQMTLQKIVFEPVP